MKERSVCHNERIASPNNISLKGGMKMKFEMFDLMTMTPFPQDCTPETVCIVYNPSCGVYSCDVNSVYADLG